VTIAAHFSSDAVVLEIVDNGVGFNPSQMNDDRPRLGLKGMQERVDLVGGTLRLRSRPGRGTKVSVKLPREEVG
jgi:signal transduction histidine kinase